MSEAFRAQQSATDRVARFGIVKPWRWDGSLELKFVSRIIRGRGFIGSDLERISGTIRREDVRRLPAPGPAARYGVPYPAESYGEARPIEQSDSAAWRAVGVLESGHGFDLASGDTINFVADELILAISDGDAIVRRHLIRGIELPGGQVATITENEDGTGYAASIDTIAFEALDRHFRVRQLVKSGTSELPTIAIIADMPELSSDQFLSVNTCLTFICDRQGTYYAADSFDHDARLLSRKYRSAGSASYGKSFPPIRPHTIRAWPPNMFGTLVSRSFELISTGYPLQNIVHSITEASTQFIDVSILHLTQALQTIFYAQALRRGDPDRETAGTDLLARRAADELNVVITDEDIAALHLRNDLTHRGFLEPAESDEAFARRVQLLHALRTLADRLVLRLLGYQGAMFNFRTGSDIEA